MADATTKPSALDALKPHDGIGHLVGFAAYFEAHVACYDAYGKRRSGAALHAVWGATDRRKAAVCELLGIDADEYDRRARAFVASLLAKHPAFAVRNAVRDHAHAFASHAALAQARAKAAPAPAAEAAPPAVVVAPAGEPRAVPHAARAAHPRGPRKVGVDPARAAAATRRVALVRDVERVRGMVEAAIFRATYRPAAPAADAA
jgi:hypothetical protein